MLRSLGSLAAGYLIFSTSAALLFQLSGQAPDGAPIAFKIASIIWGAVFALVAGWLTARVAGRRPATHAAILAGFIVLGALVTIVARPAQAVWPQVAAMAVMAPCAWFGGLLSRRA